MAGFNINHASQRNNVILVRFRIGVFDVHVMSMIVGMNGLNVMSVIVRIIRNGLTISM
jgi:hypothetical protein